VQRQRPGIAKAVPLPADLSEDPRGSAVVRSVLADLDTLMSSAAPRDWAAFGWGTPERGGARLLRATPGDRAESLRISWNYSEIENIEIESGDAISSYGPESPLDLVVLLDRLVPMVWGHIQRGGHLPPGIDRFARFL